MTTLTPFGGLTTMPIDDRVGRSEDYAAAPRELVQRSGRPMATDVSVQIAAPSSRWTEAAAAADGCMAWFDEVDRRLSRFRPESELSRLNGAAGDWFAASDVLYECAALAIASAEASDGLFDPTMLRPLCELGYDRDFAAFAYRETTPGDHTGTTNAIETPIERAAWKQIDLDATRRMIRLPADVALDFGGIAKGWAADVALARYCAAFPGALINVGGDLRALGGPQPGQLWAVGIRDPRLERAGPHDDSTHLATVSLSRGAMATSGAVRRWWLRDGQRQHHLLDPRTGRPMDLWIDGSNEPGSLIASATAFAPTAVQAEVAAKVALLRGYPLALSLVESAWERYGALGPRNDPDAGVALALVFGSGEIIFSKNLNDYLATWGTDGATLPLVVRSTRPYLSLSDFRYLEHLS
jgi:FAD:protein FMN transferase